MKAPPPPPRPRIRSRLPWALWVSLAWAAGCGAGGEAPGAARARARRVWAKRCVNCHGPLGRGDGPGARALDPPPRDLGDAAWQRGVSDEHLSRVIVEGGRAVGLSDLMPANPDLSGHPQAVAALVAKIRGLAGDPARTPGG